MVKGDSKDWIAIVNVFAASKNAGAVWKKAAMMLEDADVAYKAFFTGGEDNASALAFKACVRGYRRFIAVGGDGTIHDVLNGIAGYVYSGMSESVRLSDFTLSVLPVGSGNDWVKSAGVPRTVSEAVRLIKAGTTGVQDVVKVSLGNESVAFMANVAGVGLDARVCEIVNRQKEQGRRGKKLYVAALLYCIRHRVPVRAQIKCDGETVFEGKYLSVSVGNGKYSGGGMRQTPLAVIDDGMLDVTIIPEISLWTIAKKVPRLFTGTFHTVKELVFARCHKVEVIPVGESDAEPVEVDGEVIGRAPVVFEVMEEQINIVAPSVS